MCVKTYKKLNSLTTLQCIGTIISGFKTGCVFPVYCRLQTPFPVVGSVCCLVVVTLSTSDCPEAICIMIITHSGTMNSCIYILVLCQS